MAPILQREREPYMAFMLSSSSHHPYTIPEKYRTLRLGDLEGTMVGDYLHAIHYADQELGAFVDRLRETGILDRSVLVIYGDHQGFLGGQPELPGMLGFSEWNEFHHFQVVKRTPVLIRLPGGAAAGVYSAASSHLDVAPTVLSLLGIEDRSTVMLGRDLTRPGESLAVFRDASFADGAYYFVNKFPVGIAVEAAVVEPLSPTAGSPATVIQPGIGVYYAPFPAPIVLGSGLDLQIVIPKGGSTTVQTVTPGLRIVYVF
jgi:phosphoglycerol transferase MdoB-like AlkP superfamily enzyme